MKVCIECEKDVAGTKAVRVKEDRVIGLIRKIKRMFGASKENDLYVCEDDLKKHLDRRNSFQKSLVLFGVAAVLVFVLAIISMLLSGNVSIEGFVFAVIIGVFLILFAVVFRYTPDVESTKPVLVSAAKEEKKPRKTKSGKKTGKKRKKR